MLCEYIVAGILAFVSPRLPACLLFSTTVVSFAYTTYQCCLFSIRLISFGGNFTFAEEDFFSMNYFLLNDCFVCCFCCGVFYYVGEVMGN